MSKVAVLKSERGFADEAYLGPATLMEARGRVLAIELPNGTPVQATLALASSYQPVPGDVLLVIGRHGDHYAIGVLDGKGRTDLAFHGDVELRAIGGTLRIAADEGVEVDTPRMEVRSGTLTMIAGAVVQRFASLYQRVSALWSVHAKDAHTLVEQTSVTQAKSGVILTEETMSINGKQIHLG